MSKDGTDVTLSSPAEIYDYWYTASADSPCRGCDRRDTNCVSNPFHGVGDFDARVMYLGHDPGGASEVDSSDDIWYNGGRRWKDYPGTEEEVREHKAPSSFTKRPFSELPEYISELEAFVNRLVSNDVSGYYTNCAKCNEIREHEKNGIQDEEELNDSGMNNCIDSFLHQEIELIEPEVIVVASKGNSHLDSMYKRFEIADELPSGNHVRDYVWTRPESRVTEASDVIPSAYSGKYESTIIPAYHFSRGGEHR